MENKLKSIGLDWLRATTDSEDVAKRWHGYFRTIAKVRREHGELGRRARRLGYYGLAQEQIFIGQRDDGCMLDMSGETARELGDYFMNAGGRPSRLDFQVTVEAGEAVKELLYTAFNTARQHPKGRGTELDLEMRIGRNGPRSVTLGRRSSDYYARIYDKFEQSKQDYYRGCLRYELEIKGEAAHRIGVEYRCASSKQDFIAGVLKYWFGKHGIDVPGHLGEAVVLEPFRRPPATIESRRAWIRRQVAPTAVEIIQYAGIVGFFEDVLFTSRDAPELLAIMDTVAQNWGNYA